MNSNEKPEGSSGNGEEAEKDQNDSGNTPDSPPNRRDGQHTPEPAENSHYTACERRKWYDCAHLVVLSLTLIAAAFAAGFTGYLADIGKDTAIRQLRAYIIADSAHIVSKEPNEHLVVGFTIKNIGQTPAYDVREKLFVEILERAPISDDEIIWSWIDNHSYMGEQLSITNIEANRYNESDVAKIEAGPSESDSPGALYIVGRVYYRDIYDKPRCTDFCFMYLGDTDGRFSYCPTFNGADYPGCAEQATQK